MNRYAKKSAFRLTFGVEICIVHMWIQFFVAMIYKFDVVWKIHLMMNVDNMCEHGQKTNVKWKLFDVVDIVKCDTNMT